MHLNEIHDFSLLQDYLIHACDVDNNGTNEPNLIEIRSKFLEQI